ncbi:transcription-repair coupling factor [Butyrivibrio sp. AE2032]|uniref:transcription-repair coupling factor n=1 Tax=Butyrivibrio sp. AE2032 TaxID=1458463 RepID=UPI00068DAE01|nr:transcription-repair coupling factor [Butyrivibrio sp. AE2032]
MDKKLIELLEKVGSDKELASEFAASISSGKHLNITGLCAEQKVYVAMALAHMNGRKAVFIEPDSARARTTASYCAAFTDGPVTLLTPSELSLVSAEASSRELELSRTAALSELVTGGFGAAVITAGALLNKLEPAKVFAKRIIKLKVGQEYERDDLVAALLLNGYENVPQVMEKGEFSVRGDIVDIYSPSYTEPVRVSFFDTEIDQIKTFDRETQRSTGQLTETVAVPASVYAFPENKRDEIADLILARAHEDLSKMNAATREVRRAAELLSRTATGDAEKIRNGIEPSGIARWLGIILKDFGTAVDYVDAGKVVFFADEMVDIDARMNSYAGEYAQRCRDSFEIGIAPTCSPSAMVNISKLMVALDKLDNIVTLSMFQSPGNGLPGGSTVTVSGFPADNYSGRAEELSALIKNTDNIYLVAHHGRRYEQLKERLNEHECFTEIIDAPLPAGFSYPKIGLTIFGEQELFGAEQKRPEKKKGGNRIKFFSEIEPGDYVVHDKHGVGRYEGLINMKVGDIRKDYLKLTYAKGETLYILPENLDSLQKYVGPGEKEPKLSRLGGDEWKKSVSRAREAIKKVAYDLLKIYAARSVNKGFACIPDDEQQKLFEDRFPFVETDDQLRATHEIKADMESERPMDRLLCGDVGFGKTEVAFRAMFKAVMNGRQVIMLAPTTLLAQQHYENFMRRVKDFPVNVCLLSRFVPAAQIRQNLIDIKKGKIDVIIGTHRVLSNDVKPPQLGLLVIDEEQRFGVNHKEKIKSLKTDVDVLSLSATPIPRTLHMSLSGIRDISVLEEAPFNRRAVQTYVLGYDEQIIVQACMREIARGGQIFYLYNRTSDIDKVADALAKSMPGVRVTYAHGQMPENGLETVVADFIEGKYDILVCTTIIENGVDMPNVNTLIVENADRFGLSQLYQIKGRVGRSDRQAYAYITYNADAPLNEEATKRLNALREFTELGSGVRIAMRDLEVRGAGSLLGAEQHGQMDVIGYELYCRLLDEEVRLLKEGKDAVLDTDVITGHAESEDKGFTVEVDYDAYIPSSYIQDEAARMSCYRRIGDISGLESYSDFLDEITDRYGDAPPEVYILSGISLIRSSARLLGFVKASIKNAGVRLYLNPNLQIDMQAFGALMRDSFYGARVSINATGTLPYMLFKPSSTKQDKTVSEIVGLLRILEENKTPAPADKPDGDAV